MSSWQSCLCPPCHSTSFEILASCLFLDHSTAGFSVTQQQLFAWKDSSLSAAHPRVQNANGLEASPVQCFLSLQPAPVTPALESSSVPHTASITCSRFEHFISTRCPPAWDSSILPAPEAAFCPSEIAFVCVLPKERSSLWLNMA